jgi:uncharacterized glyoxalase superfamily protein PhnB
MLKMNAVGMVTADMKRSLDFYRSFGVPAPEYDPNEDHAQCDLGNGITLMWDTVALVLQLTPEYVHGSGSSVGICFECDSPAAVDEKYRNVIEAGFDYEREPWDAFWGQRYAILKDPDGNAVSLYAPLA